MDGKVSIKVHDSADGTTVEIHSQLSEVDLEGIYAVAYSVCCALEIAETPEYADLLALALFSGKDPSEFLNLVGVENAVALGSACRQIVLEECEVAEKQAEASKQKRYDFLDEVMRYFNKE